MTALSDQMSKIAVDNIAAHGTPIVVSRNGVAGYDVTTSQATPATPINVTIPCIVQDRGQWLGAELGRVGEKLFTFAAAATGALGFPVGGDTFTLNGIAFTILATGLRGQRGVITSYCDGVAIIHECYCARGASNG